MVGTVKIENYETNANGYSKGITADTFTFPYNPLSYDDTLNTFLDEKDFAYAFTHYGMTNPVKSKRSIIFTGHFSQSTRDSDYATLAKHCNEPKTKLVYFSTDRFFICFPKPIKKVKTGGRPLHIDYVASFVSPFGSAFGTTQKSGNSGSSQSNVGNVFTPLEIITGSVTIGVAVTIKDGSGNGFTFIPSATGTFTYYLVNFRDIGNGSSFTSYLYGEVGTAQQVIRIADVSKDQLIGLNPGQSLSSLFSGGTITGITPTFKFRDAYSGD